MHLTRVILQYFEIFIIVNISANVMVKATVYLFTSPTCPHCPGAKRFIQDFKKTRDDFNLIELSTMTHEGGKKAAHFDVMSVPTFIIIGPGYDGNIGLRGVQSNNSMNKYLDIALGKRSIDEPNKGFFVSLLKKLGP
jgi:predicted DsbA family dithiol-disulfide isomerase